MVLHGVSNLPALGSFSTQGAARLDVVSVTVLTQFNGVCPPGGQRKRAWCAVSGGGRYPRVEASATSTFFVVTLCMAIHVFEPIDDEHKQQVFHALANALSAKTLDLATRRIQAERMPEWQSAFN